MVLHQVKHWQNWKMQGCFMQFLRLIFVKKGSASEGFAPWPPLEAFCDPQTPTFQLTFPLLIPMPALSLLRLYGVVMRLLKNLKLCLSMTLLLLLLIIIILIITDIFAGQWSKQPHGLYKPGAGIMEADDRQVTSFHSPVVIPPSALDKPSIMKRCHHQRTCSHTSSRLSPMMVTLHDTRFVDCWWSNDGWTVKTVITWRSSASMIPAPGGRFACHWLISRGSSQSRLSQDNDLFKFCSH